MATPPDAATHCYLLRPEASGGSLPAQQLPLPRLGHAIACPSLGKGCWGHCLAWVLRGLAGIWVLCPHGKKTMRAEKPKASLSWRPRCPLTILLEFNYEWWGFGQCMDNGPVSRRIGFLLMNFNQAHGVLNWLILPFLWSLDGPQCA